MKERTVERLRGTDGQRLSLNVFESNGEEVLEGVLVDEGEYWYPIIRGVPCFLRGALRPDLHSFAEKHSLLPVNDDLALRRDAAIEQKRTNVTFSDKWTKFKRYGLEPSHQTFLFDWYCKKLGLTDEAELRRFYSGYQSILEVGPGSGFNSRFMAESTEGDVFALDISDAAFTTHENNCHLLNCHTVQADLMNAPFEDNVFDFIIADGVLHHTPDTRAAVRALYAKLRPGGQFFFYVYRQMGPLRKFADEYVRERFTKLTAEECYAACEGFTELGLALSKINATVHLEKGIPVLGIPPGEHDVQRLIYYNVAKCFWNDAFDFETNNMVNFDWYHPHNAWQHSQEEVEVWLQELQVTEYQFNDANPNGISVLLTKPI